MQSPTDRRRSLLRPLLIAALCLLQHSSTNALPLESDASSPQQIAARSASANIDLSRRQQTDCTAANGIETYTCYANGTAKTTTQTGQPNKLFPMGEPTTAVNEDGDCVSIYGKWWRQTNRGMFWHGRRSDEFDALEERSPGAQDGGSGRSMAELEAQYGATQAEMEAKCKELKQQQTASGGGPGNSQSYRQSTGPGAGQGQKGKDKGKDKGKGKGKRPGPAPEPQPGSTVTKRTSQDATQPGPNLNGLDALTDTSCPATQVKDTTTGECICFSGQPRDAAGNCPCPAGTSDARIPGLCQPTTPQATEPGVGQPKRMNLRVAFWRDGDGAKRVRRAAGAEDAFDIDARSDSATLGRRYDAAVAAAFVEAEKLEARSRHPRSGRGSWRSGGGRLRRERAAHGEAV